METTSTTVHDLLAAGDLAEHEPDHPHALRLGPLAAQLRSAPWRRLCVVGDSIAAGTGEPVPGYLDLSWADRLAVALRNAVGPIAYRNSGVPGARAADVLADQAEGALRFGPDLVAVAAGANDALRRSFDPPRVEAEVAGIVELLAARGAHVVTFGLFDISRTGVVPDVHRADLRARVLELNRLTARITRRVGGTFVDFFDHPARDSGIFGPDRLHLDRRGHAVMATAVTRALVTAGSSDQSPPMKPTGIEAASQTDPSSMLRV